MQRRPLCLLSVLAVAAALPVTSCSRWLGADDADVPEASMPASFPRGFPVPPDATVGTSVVDSAGNRTDVQLTWRSELTSAVQFFQLRLVEQGYLVERSEGDDDRWTIVFVRGELFGTIDLRVAGDAVDVLIGLNVS